MSETMKRLGAFVVMLMLFAGFMTGNAWATESTQITAASATMAASAKVSVGDATSSPGEEVVIPVSIADNPGIAGLAFDFTLPEGAMLKSVEAAEVLSTGSFGVNGQTVTWLAKDDNITANGVLMNLSLEAPNTPGSYEVKVALSKGKASNLVDENSDNVAVEFAAGKLEVLEPKPDKVDLSECSLSLQQESYVYDGEAKTPEVIAMDGDKVLTKGTDYAVVYRNNKEVGDATAVVTGLGGYTGSVRLTFAIEEPEADTVDLSECEVWLDNTTYTFEESPIRPEVSVYYNGAYLDEGIDYELSYKNNSAVGSASVTVTGKGYYSGSVTLRFKIVPGQQSGDNDEEEVFTIIDGVLVSYNGNETDVVVPEGVTAIDYFAFAGADITSVRLPKGLKTIDYAAFQGCTMLKSIDIPDTVTEIGESAFEKCPSLETVDLPKGLKSIGAYAFQDSGLTKISIPSGVKLVPQSAFEGCASLSSVTLPESVTEIGDSAFSGCGALSAVDFPSKLAKVGEWAFASCESLTSVDIPGSLKMISEGVFQDCADLQQVKLSEGVETIGACAFANCTSLSSISLPEGLEAIGDSAFDSCADLKSVVIPKTVKTIGDYAFWECTGIVTIAFEGSAPKMGSACFFNIKEATVTYPANDPSWTTDLLADAFDEDVAFEEVRYEIVEPTPTPELKSQSISGPNASYAKTMGDAAFSLGAKSSGDGKLTYKSSNNKIAAVSPTGVVTINGVGRATITIAAAQTDAYKQAAKEIAVEVLPKAPVLSKVTNVKGKKMNIAWKKAAGAQGYEVWYSTSKTFKKGVKKVTISKANTVKKKVKKLTKKKKYYVKVRSFAKVSGATYYSKWSTVKKVTIKK